MVNSINPFRIEGQKTAAWRCAINLGDAPTLHVLPVGNAGNITAYWKGYQEYRAANQTTQLPRMMGFQAAGAAPIVLGQVVEEPQTVATAIGSAIRPAGGGLKAVEESSGAIDMVTDEEILSAYAMVASEEGVFCEPASAASVAGVSKLIGPVGLREGDTVVCTLTGHGLKDADTAISVSRTTPNSEGDTRRCRSFVKRVMAVCLHEIFDTPCRRDGGPSTEGTRRRDTSRSFGDTTP